MLVRAVVFLFLGGVYKVMKKHLVWRAHNLYPSVCVCVCERERESERKKERERPSIEDQIVCQVFMKYDV